MKGAKLEKSVNSNAIQSQVTVVVTGRRAIKRLKEFEKQ